MASVFIRHFFETILLNNFSKLLQSIKYLWSDCRLVINSLFLNGNRKPYLSAIPFKISIYFWTEVVLHAKICNYSAKAMKSILPNAFRYFKLSSPKRKGVRPSFCLIAFLILNNFESSNLIFDLVPFSVFVTNVKLLRSRLYCLRAF